VQGLGRLDTRECILARRSEADPIGTTATWPFLSDSPLRSLLTAPNTCGGDQRCGVAKLDQCSGHRIYVVCDRYELPLPVSLFYR
jgi:hypothetical protein